MGRVISLLAISLLISACSQPRTEFPATTASEIEIERLAQEQFISNADFAHIYKSMPKKSEFDFRLAAIAERVGPAAISLCNELRTNGFIPKEQRCVFIVELAPASDDSINAFADGHKVEITRRMMQLTKDDNQLAFIIAHEFAHNIMGHLNDAYQNSLSGAFMGALLDAATGGTGNGSMDQLGGELGTLHHSADYEKEADYVGLYIQARSGFGLDKAPEIWRLLAAVNPDGIYNAFTHPTSAERFILMRKTIEEINQKRANKSALIPNIKKLKVANS